MNPTSPDDRGGVAGDPHPARADRARTMSALQLRELVDAFYADVRRDAQLGPLFERVIGPDWTAHLARIHAFWGTVALGTRSFSGDVFGKHMAIEGVEPAQFGRWLTLWQLHTERRLNAADAATLQLTAQGIARKLFHGLFGRPLTLLRVPVADGPDRFETR